MGDKINYEELFGSTSLCECKHCRSVYSPAAYLVDILSFLDTPQLDELTNRRPDIVETELSCENINTPMPYIDLVNEVLENAISPKQTYPQTTWSSEELSANPEHVNREAYDKYLKKAVFLWDMPFDLDAVESRLFLDHLGVSRYKLMEIFRKEDPTTHQLNYPSDIDIASEYLGIITLLERQIITRKTFNKLSDFWGLELGTRGWTDNITDVSAFLKNSKLTYHELVELLETRFINSIYSINPVQIQFYDKTEDCRCDVSHAKFKPILDIETADRLHRFVRLQRKLNWSAGDLDSAAMVLEARDISDNFIIQISHIKRLMEEFGIPLVNLLSWWSKIDTYEGKDGQRSLYEQCFQNKAVRKIDPTNDVFALNSTRDELEKSTVKPIPTISDNIAGVTAGLGISTEDLMLLIDDNTVKTILGISKAEVNDSLTLDNLSHLYRIISMSNVMGLPIKDFLTLKELTGIDLFDKNHIENIWRFAELVRKIGESGFNIEQLNYLYRNFYDPANGPAPLEQDIIQMVKNLRSGLNKIADDNKTSQDPTGDLTRKKLSIIWKGELVDQIISMINGTAVYAAPLSSLPKTSTSEDITFPPDIKISYNEAAKALKFTGVMTVGEKNTLNLLSLDTDYAKAVDSLFKQPGDIIISTNADFLKDTKNNFDPAINKLHDGKLKAEDKFKYILDLLLPYLRDKLSHDFIRQTIAVTFKLDNAVSKLLSDTLIPSAMSDFMMPVGLSASYQDTGGNKITRIDPDINFNWIDASPDSKIIGKFNVSWSGKISPQYSEKYTFYVVADQGVSLSVGSNLIIDKLSNNNIAAILAEIALKAGELYDIKMEYYQQAPTSTGAVELRWSSPSTPKDYIQNVNLYPDGVFEKFKQSFLLLHKAALIINIFKLSAEELSYLSSHKIDFDVFDLQQLPLDPSNFNYNFIKQWERLNDFVALRKSLRPKSVSTIIDIFAVPSFDDAKKKLVKAAGWSDKELDDITGSNCFDLDTKSNPFKNEIWPLRLLTCFEYSKRLGISAAKLFAWANKEPNAIQVQEIKNTAKAKYDENEWLAVAKPLQNILREKKRSALVSFLLHRNTTPKFSDTNELFDHFLIDVEMSACQMTSRIKQAIGSVQLFIQRAMMNLEDKVLQLDSNQVKHWTTWMKRYRVWEANRKVFLYPENWIEPELRDDKTPFFKDFESELLQREITSDTAEDAFLHYLEKLDEVGRLEIAGMYRDEETETMYVFGRTWSTPKTYYYRSFNEVSGWTPWEKVAVDIQGDHLIPVVWNRRLHIFWPVFTEKADTANMSEEDKKKNVEPNKYLEIQIAWSEYRNKKWTAKKISSRKLLSQDYNDPKEKESLLDKSRYVFKAEIDPTTGELLLRVFYNCFSKHKYTIWSKRGSVKIGSTSNSSVDGMGEGMFRFMVCNTDPMLQVVENWQVKKSLDQYFILGDTLNFIQHKMLLPCQTSIDYNAFKGQDSDLNVRGEDDYSLNTGSLEVLANSAKHAPFRVLYPHQYPEFSSQDWFFCEDDKKTFLVKPFLTHVMRGWRTGTYKGRTKYLFEVFYHPYICEAIKRLNHYGIGGLLRWPMESNTANVKEPVKLENDFFKHTYNPNPMYVHSYPVETLDFSTEGMTPYSQYNWELFFHAPLLIADRLSKNQKFSDAQKWFHYIFDPTDSSEYKPPAKFWRMRRFFDDDQKGTPETLQKLMEDNTELNVQVPKWMDNPFNPHLIARSRLGAYQKTVVMKYIDNLIRWGDNLFRQDTIEALNEATQLYILAAEILGDRPITIPLPLEVSDKKTYHDLGAARNLHSFLVEMEPLVSTNSGNNSPAGTGWQVVSSLANQAPLFCLPGNDKLLGYWDTVADRLFKIRHCMNIEGVERQLPLFEPPIDPALLVRAAAAGVDIGGVLNDLNAPLPHYRFNIILQKAVELCADVKALGGALLSAMEKRDAEELARLRSSHEVDLLKAVKEVKEKQINEAKNTLQGLQNYKDVVTARQTYYTTRQYKIPQEQTHLDKLEKGKTIQEQQYCAEALASIIHLIPDVKLGTPTTCGETYGGSNVAGAIQAFAGSMGVAVSILNTQGSISATEGSYIRRKDDWDHQADLATKELKQIEKQILAAQVRVDIAEKELENHDKQIDQANEIGDFMHDKFTNQELYDWMAGQISSIYFQSYQMAYDMAKRAEKAYQFELANYNTNYIQYGHWDSLYKGLLAGERLHYDLRRMEASYLDKNRREYEITKHASLALLDPKALIELKENGNCSINLPEALFDVEYPGHYMRRIKTVSLTIPCITGPYANVGCKLKLLKSTIRKSNAASPSYKRNGEDSMRFTDYYGAVQSIVTSNAQNDSGLFETNLRDERYLPFEGLGVVSEWQLELPKIRAFDYNTISDVILHIRYTSRDGGDSLKSIVADELTKDMNDMLLAENRKGLFRLFSAKHEFPNEWHQFLHSADADVATLAIDITDRFPYMLRNLAIQESKTIKIDKMELYMRVQELTKPYKLWVTPATYPDNNPPDPSKTPPAKDTVTDFKEDTNLKLLYAFEPKPNSPAWVKDPGPGIWKLKAQKDDITEKLEDILILFHYSISK